MFKPKTYAHLCSAMQTGATVNIDGDKGVINGIEREDGSGFKFIVTLQPIAEWDIKPKVPMAVMATPEPVRKFVRVES